MIDHLFKLIMICSFDGNGVWFGGLLLGVFLLVQGCADVGEEEKWGVGGCGWVDVGGRGEEEWVTGKTLSCVMMVIETLAPKSMVDEAMASEAI